MYKKSILPLIIFISISIGFVIGKLTYQSNNIFYSQNKDFKKLKVLIELIENNYKDEINIFDFLHKSLLNKLTEIDPYSFFLDNSNLKKYEMDNSGIFNGVGIGYLNYDDTVVISKVYENSPAEKAGLKTFDRIISVNDIDIVGLKLDTVSNIFENNKKLKLKIKSLFSNELKTINIKKKDIALNSVFYSKIEEKTGYIKINKFSQNTYDFFKTAAQNLLVGGLDYLILDLRDNPGGILKTSVDILDEFFSSNDTLIVINTNENKEKVYYASENGLLADVQLIVLINNNSASASELVSVSLQDYDRALFMGTKTYGKGVFQQNIKTVQNDFLHITTGKYYGPSGRWIDKGNLYNDQEKEFFRTKNNRVVSSRNGITPEIYYDFFSTNNLTTVLDNFAFEFVLKNKNLFENITLNKINEIADAIVDTTEIFRNYKEVSESLSLSFTKLFFEEDYYKNKIIKSDSLVIKALRIIEKDLINEKIYEQDTINDDISVYF